MNKDLFLEGVEYISAGQAAKKIGYASDYVGQLCREGKIPSRMIGRTWYVDFSALLDHKKNNRTRRKNPEISKPKLIERTAAPSPVINNSPEKSALKISPKTPHPFQDLPKSRPSEIKIAPKYVVPAPSPAFVITKKPKTKKFVLKAVSVVFVILVLALTTVSLGVTGSPNFLKLATVTLSDKQQAAPLVGSGMVVVPDSADHNSLVTRIKNYFSDDVEITFDEDHETGVITPVFHQGDDTEHYAFVMVPIKQQQ